MNYVEYPAGWYWDADTGYLARHDGAVKPRRFPSRAAAERWLRQEGVM